MQKVVLSRNRSSNTDIRHKGLVEKIASARNIRGLTVKVSIYFILCSICFVFLYPFIYMFVNSLKGISDLNNIMIKWIPSELHFENYKNAYNLLNYVNAFKNTMFLAAVCTVFHVASCSFTAYGFARFKFPGKKLFTIILLLAIVVPAQAIIIPSYIMYGRVLKWTGTALPIYIPTLFGYGLKGGLFIFIFRQFYIGLPAEFEEAARIDGCGSLRTFFKVVWPTSKSSILVVSILSFIWHWNDYYESKMYLGSLKNSQLLPQRLPALFDATQELYKTVIGITEVRDPLVYNLGMCFAATTLSVIPVLLVFLMLQRWFIEGVEHTGLK